MLGWYKKQCIHMVQVEGDGNEPCLPCESYGAGFFFFFLKVIFSHLKEHVSAKTTLRFILIMRFQRFFETKHRQEGAHTHTESVRKSRATSDHTEGSLSNSRSTQQQPHGLIETDRIQKGQESKSPVTSPQRPPCCLYPTGPKWFEPTD